MTVDYEGTTNLKIGQEWSITCSDLPENGTISWKRNGHDLPSTEFGSGILKVEVKKSERKSKLEAEEAFESHEGIYTCIDGDTNSFHLKIVYGS